MNTQDWSFFGFTPYSDASALFLRSAIKASNDSSNEGILFAKSGNINPPIFSCILKRTPLEFMFGRYCLMTEICDSYIRATR